MTGLLLRWSARHHGRQPLRSALAVLGIAVGIALLVAVQATMASASAAFAAASEALTGRATHAVRGEQGFVPVRVLAALATERGVVAAPVVEALVQPSTSYRRTVRVLGIDPLVDGLVRPGTGAIAGLSLAGLLTTRGGFVATRATCARLALDDSGATTLFAGGRAVGAQRLLAIPDDAVAGLLDVLLVDIATAQEWNGREDRVDRIDLVLDDGVDVQALSARLQALEPSIRVEANAARASFHELTAAFTSNLQAMGLLALLVGAFLVHAAMRAAVAGRQVEFALLRALGADAFRIGRAVARESVLLGLLGSGVGLVCGWIAAQLLIDPLVRTLNDHFATFALHSVRLDAWLAVTAMVLGPMTAVLASLWPLAEAMQAPPRAVFVSGRLPQRSLQAPLWLLLPLAIGSWILLQNAGRNVVMAHGGMLLALVAIALVVPRAMELLLAGTARVVANAGPWLAYVARSAASSRLRVGSSVSALVLAVGITTGMGAMVQSFRSSVANWLDEVIPADVYVALPGSVDEREHGELSADALSALRALPGLAAVSTYRPMRVAASFHGGPFEETSITVFGPSPRVLERLPLIDGGDAARAAFQQGNGAIATEPLAARLSLTNGSPIAVACGEGVRRTTIVGIERHYRNPRGELLLPTSWFPKLQPESLGLEAMSGESQDALAERVRTVVHALPQALIVSTRESVERTSLKVFDRTFAITDALRLLCILIAVLGIWSSFAALQLDRQKEIAVLRTLGATPRHVVLLVLGQTTLLGVWAGFLALPVGAFVGYVLATVVNRGSFGWTLTEFTLPPALLWEAIWLAVGSAFLAGLWPAWRMARAVPAVALREE